MDTPQTTLTAPETEAAPQPASSVASTEPTKKPLAEMASWDEYRATLPVSEPAAEVETPEPVEGAEPVVEAEPTTHEGFTLDAEGRLHRPDGTFASAEEIESYNASIPETPEPVEGAEPEAQEAPETHTVSLRARDGSTREIEVDDPELAELLRTNANDGMRAQEYRQRVAKVDAQLQELNAFRAMIETNPEAVILQHLPAEKQVAIATALIAQHFDALLPTMVGFEQDASARIKTAWETQEAIRAQQDTYQQTVAAQQHAAQLAQAVATLVPEGIPAEVETQFWSDAEQDIARALQSGRQVTPETVAEVLSHRVKLYGFTSSTAAPAAPKVAVRFSAASQAPTPAVPTATPTGEKAAQLAEQVKAKQQRIQQQQQTRRRAAAVPPTGAGAAPVRQSVVPKGASIEDASRALKKLGNNWGAYSG